MATPDFSKVWASNSPLPEYTFSDADYVTGWDFVGSAPPTKNEFDAWFKMVDTKLNWLYGQLQDTASKLYPVGSVYISFNPTSPQTLFGGTWVRMKDRVLMASGDTYAPNTTGGSATVTLNENQLPSHNHSLTTNGSHTHSASSANAGNHNHSVSGTIANAGDHTHTWSGSSESAGEHTHTFTGSSALAGNHTHTFTGSSASAGNHSHTATTSGAGNHNHTATTSTAGNHSHTRGSMNITGSFSGVGERYNGIPNTVSGAFYVANTSANPTQGAEVRNGGDRDDYFGFDASRSWTGSTSTAGNHTHTLTTTTNGNHTHTLTTNTTGSHTHTITGSNANNGAHTHTITGSNATNGEHTHTISGSNTNAGTHTHTWSGSIGNNGTHNHTISVVANGNHTHTVGNTGGGLPVNTLPPYQTVYMWRRTA